MNVNPSNPGFHIGVSFSYDYLGRRVNKSVWKGSTSGNWNYPVVASTDYAYWEWHLLGEVDTTGTDALKRTYAWGLDKEGVRPGAGGVGGLLMVADHSEDKMHLALNDYLGNVIGLANANNGTITAAYEYDPFGKEIRATGSYAAENPFRFSSQYTDNETELVYFGFRYYKPDWGRFLNRDPIEEEGGENLYRFVSNDPVNRWDWMGLRDSPTTRQQEFHTDVTERWKNSPAGRIVDAGIEGMAGSAAGGAVLSGGNPVATVAAGGLGGLVAVGFQAAQEIGKAVLPEFENDSPDPHTGDGKVAIGTENQNEAMTNIISAGVESAAQSAAGGGNLKAVGVQTAIGVAVQTAKEVSRVMSDDSNSVADQDSKNGEDVSMSSNEENNDANDTLTQNTEDTNQ